ncbi:MAG: hypothetical protein RIR89_261 [Actinomycetota bacterium]|jgi:hypothetical protein
MANVLQVKEKVAQIINSYFGEFTEDSEGRFLFPYKQTQLFIEVLPWRDMIVVQISAPVVFDIEITDELAIELVVDSDVVFGDWKIIYDDEKPGFGLLLLSHSIAADELDAVELTLTGALVVNSADNFVDPLITKFGGVEFSRT